jgi:hypothetical protein
LIGDIPLSININQNCDESSVVASSISDFQADYQLIQDQYAQYCAADDANSLTDGSLWESLIGLVKSGYNHLNTNYELLLSGEIGAIYVVALIPLLLGLVLEITLVISHRRKENRSDNRQHQTTLMTQGRAVAEKLAGVVEPYQWIYRSLTVGVILMHCILVLLFIVAVPEYDRDVWCEEHKTQHAILKAGLETERLQRYQQRANCEIRKAVILIDESVETLGSVFSKENQSTVSTLKQVVANMSDSAKKLDSTKTVIDGFQVQLEKATSNTEDVLKTLLVMEKIADQVGVNDSEAETAQAATRSLPDALKDIEGALSFQPSKDWYLSNLASKSEVKTLSLTDAQQIKLLNALAEEQILMKKQLSQLQGQIFSQQMVNSIADKVAERVRQQTTYPLILQPVPNSPAAP